MSDIYVAVRDAFDAAGRRLEDYVRRKRHDVKTLESMPHGKVSSLFPEESYGFLKTLDGREIYFHRNGVLHEGFNRLNDRDRGGLCRRRRHERAAGQHSQDCRYSRSSLTEVRHGSSCIAVANSSDIAQRRIR